VSSPATHCTFARYSVPVRKGAVLPSVLIAVLLVACGVYYFREASSQEKVSVADVDRAIREEFGAAAKRVSDRDASSPAHSSSRMVGTWTAQASRSFEGLLEDARGARPDHDPLKRKPATEEQAIRVEQFLADGRWKCTNGKESGTFSGRWTVGTEHGDRITINVNDPEKPGSSITRTFVIESTTVAREVGGAFDGVKFQRAKGSE
jgi:hypothetical protein